MALQKLGGNSVLQNIHHAELSRAITHFANLSLNFQMKGLRLGGNSVLLNIRHAELSQAIILYVNQRTQVQI
jgi:hypothetical protein